MKQHAVGAVTRQMQDLASQWVRALRGKRPQSLLSRRLGYRSNILYRWESGACFPTAAASFRLMEQVGVNVTAAIQSFLPGASTWVTAIDIHSSAGVARLLSELRGRMQIHELASALGVSRFAISRWLKGRSQPNLPELLLFVEKTSLRLLDFIAAFTDPTLIPCVTVDWERLLQSRRAAYNHPWSHAVLRALELRDYGLLTSHQPVWIAQRLRLSYLEEQQCMSLLHDCGQIQWNGTHYVPTGSSFVDTRTDPQRARELKVWWTQVSLDNLKAGRHGLFSYNLCSVAKHDLDQLEALQRRFFREMTRIVDQSRGADAVVLYAAQLFRLDTDPTIPC